MTRRPLHIALAAVATAASLAACSSTSPSGSLPGPVGSGSSGGSAGSDKVIDPGVKASSLSCPTPDVLVSGGSSVVSTLQARPNPSAASSKGSDKIGCLYDIYTPGTDLSSANLGLVQVTLTIEDGWKTVISEQQTERDLAAQQKKYEDYAADSKQNPPAPLETDKFSDTTGIGKAGFLVDATSTQSDGIPDTQAGRLFVFRDTRPYRVEVDILYTLPQQDVTISDKALDTAMHDPAAKGKLLQGIAKALIDKIG
jgi:hypothetical protein